MAQFGRPSSTITDNDWAPSAGTDLWDCVNETPASETDFIQATGNQTVELKFSSVTDPVSSSGHTLRLRGRVSTGSGGAERWTITIYQGGTLIATPFSNTTVTRTTWTDYNYTLSAAEANAISDYTDLRVRIVTNQGAAEVIQVSFIELEVPNFVPGYQVSTGNLFGEVGVGKIGPFCDANGNLYLILSDSASPKFLEAWKSTDNGQTWAEVDSANKPDQDGTNDVNGLDVVQVGSVLHIATHTSTIDDVYYHTFRMSSHANADTWGTVDKLVASYTNTSSEFGISIAVQPDGDIIIISAGDDGTYFTGRECVEYHYSQDGGVNWTTKQAFLATDSDNLAQAIVIGASSKIHGFAKEEASTRYIHRSMTDVTATPSAIESASGGVTVSGENYVHGKPAVYYDSSGNEKVVFAYPDSTYTPYVTVVTNDGTPANGVQASTTVIHRSLRFYGTTAHVAALALAVYGTDLYVIYADDATKDIWYVKSSNGGAFGAPVEIADAATVDELSANIYVRSGTIYLGVAWIEGTETSTTIRYTAYSLGTASASVEPVVGSYAVTGVQPTLQRTYQLEATTGSYAATGVEPTLQGAYQLETTAGSYAATGVEPTLQAAYQVDPAAGGYAVGGVDPALWIGYVMDAAAGAYTLTGVDPTLTAESASARVIVTWIEFKAPKGAETLYPATGSYILTGTNPELQRSYVLEAEAGSYSLAGADAALQVGYQLDATQGSYLLAGVDPALAAVYQIGPAVGSYVLTGVDAVLTYQPVGSYSLVAVAGNYELTGVNVTLQAAYQVDPVAGTYALSGVDAAILWGRLLDAGAGMYSYAGVDAVLLRAVILAGATGIYTWVGVSVTLIEPYKGPVYVVGSDAPLYLVNAATRAVYDLEEEVSTDALVSGAVSEVYNLSGADSANIHVEGSDEG